MVAGIVLMALSVSSITGAIEVTPRITDREIIESLTEIRGELKRINQRIDETNRRINALRKFLVWMGGVLFVTMGG